MQNKKHLAHRVAWILVKGEMPDGLFGLHKCDNPPCCNPDHIFLGTALDNVHDKVAKGRDRRATAATCGYYKYPEKYPRGEKCHLAKLKEGDVRMMRLLKAEGRSVNSLAKQFGVDWTAAKLAISRKTWKHVT